MATALSDYHHSLTASASTARTDMFAALNQLKEALPFAAQAQLNDGKWQALMTTLQDVNRVPIGQLIPALDKDCSEALGHPVH